MDFRYSILSDCLVLVRQCDMPLKKKLHVETSLYQMKRLLLKGNLAVTPDDCSSLQSFTDLLVMVHAACSPEYQQDVLATVTDRIDVMLRQLDRSNTPCDRDQFL